jgi:hypothetical protein
VGRPLWREDGSAICSAITRWSESCRTRNHTLLFHVRLPQPGEPGSHIHVPQEQGGPVIPRALGYRSVTSCNSQVYDGNILTLPQCGGPSPRVYVPQGQDGRVQNQSQKAKSLYDRRSVNQYVLVPILRDSIGAPFGRISMRHQEGNIKTKLLM